MKRVRSRDTRPEMVVRRLVYSLGYRYRLHRRDLPGSPDLIFPARKKAIFVHGCFWHRHPNCPNCRLPKTKLDFWRPKLEGNRARDIVNLANLKRLGWTALVIWECQVKNMERLEKRIRFFLEKGT